jgi:hypothetical protein
MPMGTGIENGRMPCALTEIPGFQDAPPLTLRLPGMTIYFWCKLRF